MHLVICLALSIGGVVLISKATSGFTRTQPTAWKLVQFQYGLLFILFGAAGLLSIGFVLARGGYS